MDILNFAIGTKLSKVVGFPYAQHMLSDTPGNTTHYGSATALRKAVNSVNFQNLDPLNK